MRKEIFFLMEQMRYRGTACALAVLAPAGFLSREQRPKQLIFVWHKWSRPLIGCYLLWTLFVDP